MRGIDIIDEHLLYNLNATVNILLRLSKFQLLTWVYLLGMFRIIKVVRLSWPDRILSKSTQLLTAFLVVVAGRFLRELLRDGGEEAFSSNFLIWTVSLEWVGDGVGVGLEEESVVVVVLVQVLWTAAA